MKRWLALALLVSGCTEVPPAMIYVAPDMLPKGVVSAAERDRSPFRGQTIVVPPVTGVGASSMQVLSGAVFGGTIPRTSVVWTETYRQALIETLQDGGLFAAVSHEGASRYVLHAEILRQAPAHYGADVTVHYTLNDTRDGRAVWDDTIAASYTIGLGPVTFFAPGQTEFVALMRACGKNIALAVGGLAAIRE